MYFGTSYARGTVQVAGSYGGKPGVAASARGPPAPISSYTGLSYGAPPRPPAPIVPSHGSVATQTPAPPAPPADVSISYRPRPPTVVATGAATNCASPRLATASQGAQGGVTGGPSDAPDMGKHMQLEVLDADLSDSPNDPVYHIKLNMSGRQYVAARHHNKLKGLVEELRTRGYRILRPFPEVEDMVSLASASGAPGGGLGGSSIPFYEGFGYSIKSLASTVLRSSAAMSLRRRCQLEQISRRIDAFLKAVFLENDDLQYEQQVYHFFWEPLEKKLSPVLEELEDEGVEEEVVPLFG